MQEPLRLIEQLFASGWSDGLPIVPPYAERVAEFVAASGRLATHVVGQVPPIDGEATVEKVAANAVMAGCLPEHMPVVLAALDAALDPRYNLRALLATTHMASTMVLINGPIRHELAFNCDASAFGPGTRANATVGRALQLIFRNVGGALPGEGDKSTLGAPSKYSYCIAEHEERNPWQPFHVERGYSAEDSTVTVYAAEGPHNVTNQYSSEPMSLLTGIASMMANLGSNQLYCMGDHFVALAPEHAEVVARAKWKKEDIQHYLFEHARVKVKDLMLGGWYGHRTDRYMLWPRWVDRHDPEASMPVCRSPQDIKVIVVGGHGKHSAYIPGLGSRSITRVVT